ncbi:hypothetical protein AB0F17_19050 [Nonomuraea sp. NPDC026600]|uniref:hypothetical protein n=1 Tax=Nonomuraea sp. NPDC026600 TaxID=3155363 RepID=UPI003401403C
MVELIHIELPGVGSGYTLRLGNIDAWGRLEFLGDNQKVWLFRARSQLADFIASEAHPAPYWRELIEHTPVDLIREQTTGYDFRRMINGDLRWTAGDHALDCSDLAAELA